MTRDEHIPSASPPRSPAARAFAWSAFVACALSVVLLAVLVYDEMQPRYASGGGGDVGAGIRAAGVLLYMVVLLGITLLGLAFAALSRRAARGHPDDESFADLALGTAGITIVALVVVGPLLLL